ncbi:MAG TPA: DNA polymerase IV, partial [Thauera aminoaromatica]|nr:DNA polymerase IV [Thauera aminoaromatica]
RFERARDRPPVHKAFVKVRFSDFSRTTAECIASAPDQATWLRLLDEAHARKALPVRLLGVGVRFAEDEGGERPAQIPLFDPESDPNPDPARAAAEPH